VHRIRALNGIPRIRILNGIPWVRLESGGRNPTILVWLFDGVPGIREVVVVGGRVSVFFFVVVITAPPPATAGLALVSLREVRDVGVRLVTIRLVHDDVLELLVMFSPLSLLLLLFVLLLVDWLEFVVVLYRSGVWLCKTTVNHLPVVPQTVLRDGFVHFSQQGQRLQWLVTLHTLPGHLVSSQFKGLFKGLVTEHRLIIIIPFLLFFVCFVLLLFNLFLFRFYIIHSKHLGQFILIALWERWFFVILPAFVLDLGLRKRQLVIL
jgi:hypothetical protein